MLVLDAGALVGIERRNRRVGALLRVAQQQRVPVHTSAAAVAQVWRDGARQANLARVLAGVVTDALDLEVGKRLGVMLGTGHTTDVVDAHVAFLSSDGDQVLTSDPDDICLLLESRAVRAMVTRV